MAKRRTSPAPQRAPQRERPKPTGETSMVLIFFLVFSILLNLGLGVATYFGFQHDDALKVKNKELEKNKTLLTDDREWYQFQALAFRAYMGQLTKPEDFTKLNDGRDKFERNQLGKDVKDRDEVAALIKTALETDRKLRTDPVAKQNYEALLDAERKRNEALVAQNLQLKADKDKAEQRKKQAEDDLAKEIAKNTEELAKFQKDSNAKLDDYFKVVQARADELDKQNKLMNEQKLADDTDKKKIEQRLAIANQKIELLNQRLAQKDVRIATLEKDLGKDVAGEIKLDNKIVNIDKNGTTAYINLGSADKVNSGLTFRVHGIGEDGRAKPRDKAYVEVLNVVDAHLSQVRVLYDYDERKEPRPQRHNPRVDPVVKGDVIFNPTWDPYTPKHVALAGAVDLIGDGKDRTQEFIRSLERQNVIVDAYLDTTDFTIKGPGISVNTDLLIITPLSRALTDARGADAELKNKMVDAVNKMRRQADDNGVKKRGLRQYLEEIGYRVPKGLSDEGADYPALKAPAADVVPPPPPPAPKPDAPPK
jgi:hypothetical protein